MPWTAPPHSSALTDYCLVRLFSPQGVHRLPSPLEVPAPGLPEQIAAELQYWGHQVEVFDCAPHNIFLCIDSTDDKETDRFQYLFCRDDVSDSEGVFHSATHIMTEIQLMSFLCSIGYARAVVLETKPLCGLWRKIVFHHSEPTLSERPVRLKTRTPWPQRGSACKTSARIIDLAAIEALPAQCCLRTTFTKADLNDFFESGIDVLCTDFDCIELQDIRAQLQPLTILPLSHASDLDRYDRMLIFTDGSSKPAMRRKIPQQADESGQPDRWSMIAFGEIFDSIYGTFTLELLGWLGHPVRYDQHGSAYMGIQRLGSDMAERAALIGAGAWRLSLRTMRSILSLVPIQ